MSRVIIKFGKKIWDKRGINSYNGLRNGAFMNDLIILYPNLLS